MTDEEIETLARKLVNTEAFYEFASDFEAAVVRAENRLWEVEGVLNALVDEQPIKGAGALGGKRKIHMFSDALTTVVSMTNNVPTMKALCSENGDIFTRNWSFVNCKKCRAVGEKKDD